MVKPKTCSRTGYARLSQLGNRDADGALPTPASRSSSSGSTALVQEQFDRAARWNEAGLELFQEPATTGGSAKRTPPSEPSATAPGTTAERPPTTQRVLSEPEPSGTR